MYVSLLYVMYIAWLLLLVQEGEYNTAESLLRNIDNFASVFKSLLISYVQQRIEFSDNNFSKLQAIYAWSCICWPCSYGYVVILKLYTYICTLNI